MATLLRFYSFSFVFTLICLGLGAWYGWASTATPPAAWSMAMASGMESRK